MKRTHVLGAMLLCLTPVLGACASDGPSGGGGGKDNATVGVMLLNGDTYFTNVAKGIKTANGGKTIVENYDGDAGKESQAIDNLIARNVDAIVTSPLDGKASAAGLKRAAQAGIKVICYNTCIDDNLQKGVVSAFVLSDQAGMGEQTGAFAAAYIKKNITGPVNFGVLHCDTFDICKQRKDAFFKTLKDAGVTYTIEAQDEQLVVDKAVPAAEDMLTSHPNINVMWGANDGATAGLVRAVNSSPSKGKVVVFGSDMTPVLGKLLAAPSPTLLTTTGQDGAGTGKKAFSVVKTLLADKKVTPFVQEVPVVNYSVNDRAAVDAYLAAN